MTNWKIEQPPKIAVTPKLVYQSKGVIGITIAVVGAVLQTLGQQPWFDPNIAKLLTPAGLALAWIGQVDRPELFFRKGKMQEAILGATKELTLEEGIKTLQQTVEALTAPDGERPGKLIQLAVDTQERFTRQDEQLARQDEALARIESAATANQFPRFDYPDKTDLPRDPRQQAQMEAPPLQGWESDVSQSSDGVINPGDVI